MMVWSFYPFIPKGLYPGEEELVKSSLSICLAWSRFWMGSLTVCGSPFEVWASQIH